MTAVHSPEVFTLLVSARPSTASTTPKLRNSCHGCAASKVKCNKEKPTCARCVKRGLACEYFVTKRPGRKHDARSHNITNVTLATPVPCSSTSSETGILTSPNLIQPFPKQNTSDHSNTLPSLLSPADSAWSLAFTTFSTDLDDIFASPISFPVPETSDHEISAQPHIDSRGVNNGLLNSNGDAAFLIPEDAFSVIDEAVFELPTLSKPCSPSNSRASTTSNAQSSQGFGSESPCCCLIRALDLLKQPFPNASTVCTRSRQGYEHALRQLPTIQSVVAENEQIIKAITNILQCPCSQDGYLLTIMSLIVFKVLSWYAAAARETPVTNDNSQSSSNFFHPNYRQSSLRHSEQVLQCSTAVGNYCIEGENQGHTAAQLVLGELHRVQRLINLLSQQFKDHGMHYGTVVGPYHSAADGQDTLSNKDSTFSPFSAIMLNQLEADLRKRLRALSSEIVDMLRRG